MNSAVRRQCGMVLVVALVMLLAVTLMVVTASNTVQTNLKIASNTEARDQVRLAAVSAIEEAISSNRFTSTPGAVFANACEVSNRRCYDIDGDGNFDVRVQLAPPSCVQVTPILNSALDAFASPAHASCFWPPGRFSMCADTIWEFQATATDTVTGAQMSVRQGVSILTSMSRVSAACPT